MVACKKSKITEKAVHFDFMLALLPLNNGD